MIARPTKDRTAAGYNASTGRLSMAAGGDRPIIVPDDRESVCGWLGYQGGTLTFWPAQLDTVAQLDNARMIAGKLGAELGGSPLTSRAVFAAMRQEVAA